MHNFIFALNVNKCIKFVKEFFKYIEGKGKTWNWNQSHAQCDMDS